MLSRFYRWVTESGRLEYLEDLGDWITEESEYQVKALEAAEGREESRRRMTEDCPVKPSQSSKSKCDIYQ